MLTLFLHGQVVARVSRVLNRNDLMDQRIGYTGEPFDRARFFYDVRSPGSSGLIEVVDDIRISPLIS